MKAMKPVIVIGGSSGIGYAIMQKLSLGYTAVNLSRREAKGFLNITTDVTKPKSVKNAFSQVSDKYGTPYAMVYCPGFVEPQGISNLTQNRGIKQYRQTLPARFYAQNNI